MSWIHSRSTSFTILKVAADSIEAISHGDFIGMKEDPQTLFSFAVLAGKWPKKHTF